MADPLQSEHGNPGDENAIIDRLVARDRVLAGELDSIEPFSDSDHDASTVGPLNGAADVLQRLQSFATRNQFPRSPMSHGDQGDNSAGLRDTPGAHHDLTQSNTGHGPLPPQDDTIVPDSIGRFRILKQLGVGGFGIVFLAFDPALKRNVAIKILRPESLLTEESRIRFERESQLVAMLSHPAIVKVFETGTDGPIRYIVFDYVEGESLAAWLSRNDGPVAPGIAASLIARVAEAVAAAHANGVLHRDLKPGNLLLSGDSSSQTLAAEQLPDRIHVVDFGLAVNIDVDSSLTCSGMLVGTPIYVAPELVSGDGKPSKASDVYALGVILYELLGGRRPFDSDSGLRLLRSIVEQVPTRFRSLREYSDSQSNESGRTPGKAIRVPRDLEAICFKCLEKNRGSRYPSANELAIDLRNWQAGKPVSARRVTPVSQLCSWAIRKPVIASLTGLVSMLLISIAVGTGWSAWKVGKLNSELRNSWFESLLKQSQLHRQTSTAGRSEQSLKAIQSATELVAKTDRSRRLLELRNEAIEVSNQWDLKEISRFRLPELETSFAARNIAFDSKFERIVYADAGSGFKLARISGSDLEIENRQRAFHSDAVVHQIEFVPRTNSVCIATRIGEAAAIEIQNLTDPALRRLVSQADTEFSFDVSADGQIVVCGNTAGEVILAFTDSSREPRVITSIDTARFRGATFAPDSQRVAVWNGNRIDVWDIERDSYKSTHCCSFSHSFNSQLETTSVSWSPCGSRLASTTNVYTTHLWSLDFRESQHLQLGGHTGWTWHAIFDPTGTHVATSSSDQSTHFWDYQANQPLVSAKGSAIAISEDGSQLAAIDGDEIVIWQIEEEQFVKRWECDCESDFRGPVVAATARTNRDASLLAYVGADSAGIRDLRTGVYIWEKAIAGASDVAFSGDGKLLFIADSKKVSCLDVTNFKIQTVFDGSTMAESCEFIPYTLSASHDGSHISVGTCSGNFMVDTHTGDIRLAGPDPVRLGGICFHPSKSNCVIPSERGLKLVEYRSGTTIWELSSREFESPLCFDNAGDKIALHRKGRAVLMNLGDQSWVPIGDEAMSFHPREISFSPDGQALAVATNGDAISLFSLCQFPSQQTVDEVARLPHNARDSWVAFSSGTSTLVSADSDYQVYEWELDRLRKWLETRDLNWTH